MKSGPIPRLGRLKIAKVRNSVLFAAEMLLIDLYILDVNGQCQNFVLNDTTGPFNAHRSIKFWDLRFPHNRTWDCSVTKLPTLDIRSIRHIHII